MKNTLVTTAVAAVLGTASFGANALSNGDTLNITAGGSAVTSCVVGSINPATGNCALGGVDNVGLNITSQTGSYFILGPGPTNLIGNEGIVLGSTQLASGNHTGAVNGSETPSIDTAWTFSSNTGMHQSTSPITVISQTEIDMTGWAVIWGGVGGAGIPMGGCSLLPGGCDADGDGTAAGDNVNTGIASITITGNNYVLDYFANVPMGAPFEGAGYTLHLEGTITEGVAAVPVPAAVWLFGSGLVGLAGVARRRKANA